MNNDALEQYISELRVRAKNLLVPYVSKEQLGRASGYQHCADELQSMVDAEKEQQPRPPTNCGRSLRRSTA